MYSLYECFENTLNQIKKKYQLNFDKIMIAVSGGADSLALAYLMCEYSKQYDIKLAAITVNHHLRKESDEEAKYVADLMKSWGIEHHILDWHSNNPKSGMEEKARIARYSLLEDWAHENGYTNIMTAHHQKDQAETFLMRLQRGSGVDGLASMNELSHRNGVSIIRPLLSFSPECLQSMLEKNNISWVHDSSNDCDDFLRVRIRKLLPILDQSLGISVKRIADTAAALNDVRDYFEGQVEKFLKSNVKLWENVGASFFPKNFNVLHNEIKVRILANLIKRIGKKYYSPIYEELIRLIERLDDEDFKGCTLGGCEILRYQNKIWIVREIVKPNIMPKKEWESFVIKNPKYKNVMIPYKLKINMVRDF